MRGVIALRLSVAFVVSTPFLCVWSFVTTNHYQERNNNNNKNYYFNGIDNGGGKRMGTMALLMSSGTTNEDPFAVDYFGKSFLSSSSDRGRPPPPGKKKALKTFLRYLQVESWKNEEIRDLEEVFRSIGDACKQIARIVQRAQTDDLYGDANPDEYEENVQGEVPQKLDVLCNEIFKKALCGCSRNIVAAIASEEEDCPCACSEVMNDPAFASGRYVAVFDPLDGSKNIDSSLPVGTIFGIYRAPAGRQATVNTFLENGAQMVAAGYCLYSATTVLVLTMGSGVDGFTLDPDRGIFLHTHEDIRLPPLSKSSSSSTSLYSVNEANAHEFNEPTQTFLQSLKIQNPDRPKSTARYVGALVADVHNVLVQGGIYLYPGTVRQPQGKLRLLYEACPMALILEQAGGAGSTGLERILQVTPTSIHQRVPTFLGNLDLVFEVDQYHKYYGTDDDDNNDDNDQDNDTTNQDTEEHKSHLI